MSKISSFFQRLLSDVDGQTSSKRFITLIAFTLLANSSLLSDLSHTALAEAPVKVTSSVNVLTPLAIKLDIPWSDLGSWREISKIYQKNKAKYFKKKNVHYRPWGKYVNLFEGKNFLVKELTVNSKSSISLQKHYHRSEHWMITHG